MDQLDSLSTSQREAVASFQAITNTDELDTAITLLQSANWNLEAAVSSVYDREPGDRGTTRDQDDDEDTPLMDEFGIDDSEVMPPSGRGPPRRGGFAFWLRQLFALPLGILSLPASILYGAAGMVLGFLARILRIRPGAPSLRPRNPFARDPHSRSRLDPTSAAERWIRSLEESTGAVRWSRRNGEGSSSSVAGSSSAAGLERRSGANGSGGGPKCLPDFWEGGYEQALRRAKEDIKVLVVILTCDEHQDDEEFKRDVLTDPDLLQTLSNEGVIVWGGDIRDRDAYQVSKTLQPYSLPFISFIALQPPPATTSLSDSSSPRMSVISRVEGSPSTATSAASLVTHLTTIVIPRVTPFLTRLRQQAATRLAERRLREEQDRAYALAAARDEERVLKVRAEEGRKKRESEERERKAHEVERLRDGAKRWRAWMRGVLEREGEAAETEVGIARVGVRLGDGRRAVRRFGAQEKVERVYAFVECALEKDDGERLAVKPSDYTHIYEFRLATTFPRQVLDIDGEAGDRTLTAVGWLTPSASLVVEGLEQRRISFGESTGSDEEEEEEEEEED